MSRKSVADVTLHLTRDEIESLYILLAVSIDSFQNATTAALKANDLEIANLNTERKKLAVNLAQLFTNLVRINDLETLSHN